MVSTKAFSVLECTCSAAGTLPISATMWNPSTHQVKSAQWISWKRTTLRSMNLVQAREAKKGEEGQTGEDQGLATGNMVEDWDLLLTMVTRMAKNKSYTEEEVVYQLPGEADRIEVNLSDTEVKDVVSCLTQIMTKRPDMTTALIEALQKEDLLDSTEAEDTENHTGSTEDARIK